MTASITKRARRDNIITAIDYLMLLVEMAAWAARAGSVGVRTAHELAFAGLARFGAPGWHARPTARSRRQ